VGPGITWNSVVNGVPGIPYSRVSFKFYQRLVKDI
jgi:hypothetical protein